MISQAKALYDRERHVNFAEFEYPEFLISGGVRNKMNKNSLGPSKGPYLPADANGHQSYANHPDGFI